MEYLALFNFIYLILYFVWETNFNNPYRKEYKIKDKKYRRESGEWSGSWCELKEDWDDKWDDKAVDDLQILDDLNRFEKYTIFRLNNRSQYALMFLAFVNMCFLGPAIEGTWVEDMLRANA